MKKMEKIYKSYKNKYNRITIKYIFYNIEIAKTRRSGLR